MILQPLIAIVDDDDGMRKALDALARSLGYRTATFDAAEPLLKWPGIGEAGCVISDIEMPGGMDGIELTVQFRKRYPDLPIILVSAYVTDRICADALAAGAFAVLKKPFVGEALIEAIETALPREGQDGYR